MKISPNPSFPKRGIPPFAKGGQEGFSVQCFHNYGLINKSHFISRKVRWEMRSPAEQIASAHIPLTWLIPPHYLLNPSFKAKARAVS